MRFKFLYYCLILKLAAARYVLPTKQDEQVTELATEIKVNKDATKSRYTPLQSYARYQIVTPMQLHKSSQENINNDSTTSSTTTTALTPPIFDVTTGDTVYTPAEFPHDLLEIAQKKLGLRNLDEVPSISELSEFLGTSTTDETLKYIRHLTSTEQGIALIKAYLESADYTDRTAELRRKELQSTPAIEKELPVKVKGNLFDRIVAYLHTYNLWPQKNVEQQSEHMHKHLKPQLERIRNANVTAPLKPILVRNPLPYHYPVPLRPMLGTRLTPLARPSPVGYAPVHLNTPKFHVPPHIQLARLTNIPPQYLESLIKSKPKLAELAAKVNRFTIASYNGARMDAQLMAAIRRAIEQDVDLRKLMQTTAATLL